MLSTLLSTTLLTVTPIVALHSTLAPLAPTAPLPTEPGSKGQVGERDRTRIGVEEPTGAEVFMVDFAPVHTTPRDLVGIAEEFIGRDVYIEDPGQGGFRAIRNMRYFQDRVIVLETAERVDAVLEALGELDEYARPQDGRPSAGAPLAVTQISPQHISVDSLFGALQPYQRLINERMPDGQVVQSRNMTIVRESGQIVIRDSGERTREIIDLAASIDTPVPQLDLVCMVIRGLDPGAGEEGEGDRSENLPADLVASLSELLPHEGYERAGVGALRIAAVPGTRTSLVLTGPSLVEHTLDLTLSTFDGNSRSLDISNCSFGMRGNTPLFQTTTRIGMGEYVVLGVSGEDPLFVVLKVQ